MFIGIDDTDSIQGNCTTYIAAILCEKLPVRGYPRLVRLDPNVPFKTRGNGAISLEVKTKNPEGVKALVLEVVKKHAQFKDKNTNPGVVFLSQLSKKKKKILEEFYFRAVSEVVQIEEAEEVARKVNAEIHKFKLGRGIIGALAAIGATLEDKTYELMAYRKPENLGTKRKFSVPSVFQMNLEMYAKTFDNVDLETRQVLLIPHGLDPVFSGIRGGTPRAVEKAWELVKPLEGIERWQIFETNQGTDAHFRPKKISQLKDCDSVISEGTVSKSPRTIQGGHVIFELTDGTGKIDCAAYGPTGKFRNLVRKLIKGDKLRVYGGIGKYPKTVNLEKIQILELEKKFQLEKPYCCEKRMTSAGKGKGFKCKRCGKKEGEEAIILKEIPRKLKPGFYEVPPRARRHPTRPLIMQKSGVVPNFPYWEKKAYYL